MLEKGTCSSIKEIADTEKINESYVGRVLRLTLLAPDLVESIVNRSPSTEIALPALMKPFPSIWRHQRSHFALKE